MRDGEGRLWEWEINNAINNLGRSHLSSRGRQLVREMNGLSLSSLCPWLRALKLAPPHSHTNGKREKKRGFLSSFKCLCISTAANPLPPPPPSPPAAVTATNTNTQVQKNTLWKRASLKQNWHAEARRGCWWRARDCGSAHVHTRSFSTTPLGLSICPHLSVRLQLSLSGLQVCYLGFNPCSIFLLNQRDIHAQFNEPWCRVPHTLCLCCCSLCFPCRVNETDQQLWAMCTLFIKLQTPPLLNNCSARRKEIAQTYCEISSDAVFTRLFLWCVLFIITAIIIRTASFLMPSSFPPTVMASAEECARSTN